MTTPPHYVYMAVCMNYRSADEWYFVGASFNPLQDVKRVTNNVVSRYGTSRRVLWCIECQDAADVARELNDWLQAQDVKRAGVNVVTYLLGYEDVDAVKARARECVKNFKAQ